MADLHLNLKAQYFNEIKAGTKVFEFRLAAKWHRRLLGKHYGTIYLKLGYPRAGDSERVLERPWRGFELRTIVHPHFGPDPVEVCAIRVN